MALPGNEHLVVIPSMCTGWKVAVDSRKGRGEVYCRVRGGLDQSDALSSPATHKEVQRELEFHRVNNPFQLVTSSAGPTPPLNRFQQRTIWSIMMRILVLACSELSVSPYMAIRNLWFRPLSPQPLKLAPTASGSVIFGVRRKTSVPVKCATRSRCSRTALRTPSEVGSITRLASMSTYAHFYQSISLAIAAR